ncbi:MAG: DEAD/DEAH box helicase [Bdellovibrionales bacterium]|nr:DEAD/DEAH box helicase [Bdellovibrionales bacterium]
MHFNDFQLHPKLLKNISLLGYDAPTPIQEQAIPVILEGGDVIGLAQTGTGKTAAFALPVLHELLASSERRIPRVLVLAPTRELVDQIFDSFRELGCGSGLSGVTLYGGDSMKRQIRLLERGVDVVIACPGRLLDHLQRGTFDPSSFTTVILDEADHMFDMGFLPVVRRIRKFLPQQRQTLLFTATMPEEVARLANEMVTKPTTIQVGTSGLSETVSHSMYSISDSQKNPLLLELVGTLGEGSAIVFTRTKRRAKGLGDLLQKGGLSATALQGNLSQSKRRDAIEGFRSGKYKVLVATDIAARGIDVSRVSHVVNYDMPDTVEAYTHRTGRTGRATRLGDALSFTTASDRSIVRRIEKHLQLRITTLPTPPSLPSGRALSKDSGSSSSGGEGRRRSSETSRQHWGSRSGGRRRYSWKQSSRRSASGAGDQRSVLG